MCHIKRYEESCGPDKCGSRSARNVYERFEWMIDNTLQSEMQAAFVRAGSSIWERFLDLVQSYIIANLIYFAIIVARESRSHWTHVKQLMPFAASRFMIRYDPIIGMFLANI
ncbi:unnamed protein product [Lasius platythorax]|uniref:Uncharacterized protein n=1 Tax=Lasius platythorax TaxID=488582 RepID=A0AAV2NFG2_9HYME